MSIFKQFKMGAGQIVGLLFPQRHDDGLLVFDFSRAPPSELARSLPKAGNLRGTLRSGAVALKLVEICLSYKNPVVKMLIRHIKSKKDTHAFTCAGYVLSEKLKDMVTKTVKVTHEKPPIIIPMPIHRKRLRERGYNQCELLAYELKRSWKKRPEKKSADTDNMSDMPNTPDIIVRTDILFRRDESKSNEQKKQASKNRTERISGIKGVFTAHSKRLRTISDFDSRLFIVLDDVLTTGSTMNEAIAILQSAGCKNVRGLALAH